MAATNKTKTAQADVDALTYRAADDTARETSREAASKQMAPDWYDTAPGVADVVSDVWEPIVRSLVIALESAHQSCAEDDMAHLTLARAKAALGAGTATTGASDRD